MTCKRCQKAVSTFKQASWDLMPENYRNTIPIRMTKQFGYEVSAIEKLTRRSDSKQTFADIAREAAELENKKLHISVQKYVCLLLHM